MATFDENRRAVGNAETIRVWAIKMKARTISGGRRDDTCDHGLSRRLPRSRVELESKSYDKKVYLVPDVSVSNPLVSFVVCMTCYEYRKPLFLCERTYEGLGLVACTEISAHK